MYVFLSTLSLIDQKIFIFSKHLFNCDTNIIKQIQKTERIRHITNNDTFILDEIVIEEQRKQFMRDFNVIIRKVR